jgi:hypothetical protein
MDILCFVWSYSIDHRAFFPGTLIGYSVLFKQLAETVDIGTCDQSVPKAYPGKGTIYLNS